MYGGTPKIRSSVIRAAQRHKQHVARSTTYLPHTRAHTLGILPTLSEAVVQPPAERAVTISFCMMHERRANFSVGETTEGFRLFRKDSMMRVLLYRQQPTATVCTAVFCGQHLVYICMHLLVRFCSEPSVSRMAGITPMYIHKHTAVVYIHTLTPPDRSKQNRTV